MHRLFVAIRPPQAVRAALLDRMGGVPAARWQDDGQLHLTLRFLGGVDPRQADEVAAALGMIHAQPFAIRLTLGGAFDGTHGRQLWAGVERTAELLALARKVDRAACHAGIAADPRSYHPHVTLARLPRSAPPPILPPALRTFEGLGFMAETFALFESMLTRDGACYHLIERYRLA